MADARSRALALVTKARTTTPGQAQFAARVQAVLAKHQDITAEATWQDLSRVIMQHWLLLCGEQPPVATWGMLTRCTETILKVRRVAQRGQDSSGEEALEAFRAMMRGVMGKDEGEGTPSIVDA